MALLKRKESQGFVLGAQEGEHTYVDFWFVATVQWDFSSPQSTELTHVSNLSGNNLRKLRMLICTCVVTERRLPAKSG